MNDEKYSVFVHSKSYPTVFFFTVFFVFDRQHVRVKEDLRSALETDFMVSQVSSCLCWVPFKIVLHGLLPVTKSSGMGENNSNNAATKGYRSCALKRVSVKTRRILVSR